MEAILGAVQACVKEAVRGRVVKGVCVTGQMHGVVLWTSGDGGQSCSRLVTWQDRRCSPQLLQQWNAKAGSAILSGYGCATLAWCAERGGLDGFDRCGTIMVWWCACGVLVEGWLTRWLPGLGCGATDGGGQRARDNGCRERRELGSVRR